MTAQELSKLIKETTRIGNKHGRKSKIGGDALKKQAEAKKAYQDAHGKEALLAVMMPQKGGFKLHNSKGQGSYGV